MADIELDESDWRNANWLRAGWIAPKYKTDRFMAWMREQGCPNLADFRRHYAMFWFAVDRGQIKDDKWVGAWPPDDPMSIKARKSRGI